MKKKDDRAWANDLVRGNPSTRTESPKGEALERGRVRRALEQRKERREFEEQHREIWDD